MAQYAYTFTSGDVVTPTKLNNARTVSEIVNADIKSDAAIAGAKIAPDFGSQNVVTTASVATFQNGSTDGAVVSSLNSSNNGLWTWVGNASGGGAHIGKQVSSSSPPTLTLYKSRGGNTATPTVVSSGDGVGTISFKAHDGTGWIDAAAIGCGVDGTPGTNDMPGRLVFSTTADGASSVTERMRITSDGTVFIGKTTSATGTDGHAFISDGQIRTSITSDNNMWVNRNGTNGNVIVFRKSDVTVGTIAVTTTATAYNTSSDYRLKENPSPLIGGLATINQLQPCQFTWKSDGSTGRGFIAHELQAVVPEAVTGEKDAVDADGNPQYQGVDAAKVVPYLVSAIKELKARVEALEAAQ